MELTWTPSVPLGPGCSTYSFLKPLLSAEIKAGEINKVRETMMSHMSTAISIRSESVGEVWKKHSVLYIHTLQKERYKNKTIEVQLHSVACEAVVNPCALSSIRRKKTHNLKEWENAWSEKVSKHETEIWEIGSQGGERVRVRAIWARAEVWKLLEKFERVCVQGQEFVLELHIANLLQTWRQGWSSYWNTHVGLNP